MLRRRLVPALLAGLLLAAAAPQPGAFAQAAPAVQAETADFKGRLAKWQATLARTTNRVAEGDLANDEYEALRGELAQIQKEAREAAATVIAARDSDQQMLASLGAAPAQGEPAEAAPVATERKRLSQAIAESEGRVKQVDLVVTRIDILLRTAADQRMTELTEQILKRGPVPLAPASWAALPVQAAYVQDRIRGAFAFVLSDDVWRERIYGLGGLAALVVLVAWPARRFLLRRYGHRDVAERPSYRQRVAAMAVEALARCLIPVVPTVAFTTSLVGLLQGLPEAAPVAALVAGVSGGIVSFFLTTGIARATLAPDHPAWQLAELDPDSARRLVRRIAVAAIGLAAGGTGIALIEGMFVPPELRSILGFGTMAVVAAALLSLLPGRLWLSTAAAEADCGCPDPAADAPPVAEPVKPRPVWPRLRILVGAVALASLAAAGAGYLALGIYASKLMLATIIVGGMLLVARGILRELLCILLERGGRLAEVRDIVAGTGGGQQVLGQVGRALIDLALVAAAVALLMPLTGMTVSEMRGVADTFLRGVTVGGVRIAPGDILSAALVLAAAIAATRFVQRQLDERILGSLAIDLGVRNSIRTGVGYLGTTLAVLASVGTLGLDLSSLAMIAGALSVGIGFGLQNVVSNFISGLIMLVERPIKVGDWVVVNGMEGTVRRISVRATEIQTFQRASVIVPNSEFISKAVVNWTLKDRTTRVEIKVRAAYDSDVRLVYDLLLKIGREHHLVLRTPEPAVVFKEFGPSALDFELRIFVANTDFIVAVRNELRMRILEEFRAHGIQMPFDQQIVHMPKVEALLQEIAATPRRKTVPSPVDAAPAPDESGKIVPIAEKVPAAAG